MKKIGTRMQNAGCAALVLQQKLERVLDNLLQLLDPLTTNGTVDDLVVETAGDDDLVVPLGDGAFLGLHGDGNLAGGADSQDTGLRGVDDGSEALNSGVHAHVGDSEGTTLVLLGLELVLAGALAKVLDLVGDAGQTQALDVLDNGGDQTRGGSNSNADVGGAVLTDDGLAALLAPAGVDLGNLHEGDGAGLDQEIVDGELVLAIGGGVQGLAQLEQLGHGQGGGHKVVGVVGHGLLEAVGNGLAHGGNGDILEGRTSGGTTRGLVLLNILLGDHSAAAGALEGLDGDTLLQSQSLGSRADRGLTVQAGLELVARGLGLLRGGFRSRCRGGWLSALGLLLLLGSRGGLVTTGISEGEGLEGRNVGTLLNKDGNGLRGGKIVSVCFRPKSSGEKHRAPAAEKFGKILTEPTGTSFSPDSFRTFARTPSSWNSKSICALSVSISTRTSPGWRASPAFFCHAPMFPAVIVGDRAGMLMMVWGGKAVVTMRLLGQGDWASWMGPIGYHTLGGIEAGDSRQGGQLVSARRKLISINS